KSEGVSVPANPKPGDTWSQTVRIMGTIQVGNQSLNAELQFKTACKPARMETVTVPAGRFDALRVDCTRETRGKASQGGTSQEFPPSTEETKSWLAAGIGLVKSTSPATGEANLLKYGLP
ncbi:MAG: DUF3108 domain-containing protein, partial [Thermoflexales bacterium]|nr:DUF3108 domain-containing protein [Thermoflexales bacterium]